MSEGFVPLPDGVRLRYRVSGTGSQTVIVPSLAWLAADLEPLASRRRLIFYDSRNRGGSDVCDPSKLGIDFEVRDLEVIRQHFGLERMSLLGWSYKGGVAALYLIEHRERVERLLLVGSMSPRSAHAEQARQRATEAAARADPDGLRRLETLRQAGVDRADPARFCREFNRVHTATRMGNPSAYAQLRSDPCVFPNEWPDRVESTLGHVLGQYGDWDWRPQLASLDVPTLVIHGERDVIPLAGAEDWALSLGNARLLVIPDVGHFPWAESPGIFFPAANTFLSGRWPQNAVCVRTRPVA
jgi:proline iminopeptidase